MDAHYYGRILEKDLLLATTDEFEDVRTIQQNNTSIHTAVHTKCWLESNNINLMA